jgi:hypothetical protein
MFKNKFNLKLFVKIIIILIIITISALASYLLSKQINKINASMVEKKEMDYLISNREAVSNQIKTDFLEVDSNYQAKIDNALPSVYNVLSFVDAMESLAKKNSFKQNLTFNQPTAVTDISGPLSLTLINFNVTIEDANINTFINYLKDFEGLPYFASIDSINYLGSNDNGWENNSTINISGSFYAHQ